ncbi:MAG: peptide chain release factor-like protein [Candidatus Omnitrophica bacterium]|nr:peptide chain release factor-like protein [Candidatus Omnitrophota bacterium]
MNILTKHLGAWEKLILRMRRMGIRRQDIAESFTPSSRPGGQNVNKTATCVTVRHLPTGVEARCQQERSQGRNRFLAHEALLDKIEGLRKARSEALRREIERKRRSRRVRSARSAARILEEKRLRSAKKKLRAQVRETE